MKLAALATATLTATASFAGPAGDVMAQCLVKKSTGQDRIELVQWMVIAYSHHPDVSGLVTRADGAADQVSRQMAAVVNRLLLEDCRDEAKAAIAAEGQSAIENSFRVFGEVAAQELIVSPEVNATITSFTNYLDGNGIQQLFR